MILTLCREGSGKNEICNKMFHFKFLCFKHRHKPPKIPPKTTLFTNYVPHLYPFFYNSLIINANHFLFLENKLFKILKNNLFIFAEFSKPHLMNSEIILYQSEDGQTKVKVRMEGETVWLSLNQLAELFQTTKQNISLHIKNIFSEAELSESATV